MAVAYMTSPSQSVTHFLSYEELLQHVTRWFIIFLWLIKLSRFKKLILFSRHQNKQNQEMCTGIYNNMLCMLIIPLLKGV